MLPANYKPEDLGADFGKEVDRHIAIKNEAKVNLSRSSMALFDMGAKVLVGDQIMCLPNLDIKTYVKQNYQEFAWEAEYDNGTVIKQFGEDGEHHFGHIEQSKLAKFRWVSCFVDETSNAEKRVIVELDFKTGLFNFVNGFVPQEVRAIVDDPWPQEFQPKLIMKAVKRNSETFAYPEGSRAETIKYNRYLIGWENAEGCPVIHKRILCVEPNGFTHFWHG